MGCLAIVIDGIKTLINDRVQNIVFSPDSKRLVYSGAKIKGNGKKYVVLDGVRGKKGKEVYVLILIPNSES